MLGGLISRRRLSTFSTLFPQYHLCVLCFVLNQRPRSCLTTPRKTQCMVSIAIPLTISKLGSCNKGLGALKPQTYKTDLKVSITCTSISPKTKWVSLKHLAVQIMCRGLGWGTGYFIYYLLVANILTVLFCSRALYEWASTLCAVLSSACPDTVFRNGKVITWPLALVLTISPCSSQ